jgi:hypothetical protein
MYQFPVRIEKPAESIDPTLRLKFNSVFTIEHSAQVRNVGRIDRDCLKLLKSAFLNAMGGRPPENDNMQGVFRKTDSGEDGAGFSTKSNYDVPTFDKAYSAPVQYEENCQIVTASHTETLHKGME